jgi:gamma-glutamyl hydrolase
MPGECERWECAPSHLRRPHSSLHATPPFTELDPTGAITQGFDSKNISWPLNLTQEAGRSRMLAGLGTLRTAPTFNNHQAGLGLAESQTPPLRGMYHVLSTTLDRQGHEFVATVEGSSLPFYGVQWHPEKAVFEHGAKDGHPYEAIDHGAEAVQLAQHLASFFVSEARRSQHRFPDSASELAFSSYNAAPTAYAPEHPMFMRVYRFNWTTTS